MLVPHPPSRQVVFIEHYRIAIADPDRARTVISGA